MAKTKILKPGRPVTGNGQNYDTKLARLMKSGDLRPQHVAGYAEVSAPTILRFMSGEREPRLTVAEKIREFLSLKLKKELTLEEIF